MAEYDHSACIAEYESNSEKRERILNELRGIVIASGSALEGNCFYFHGTLDRYSSLYTKQVNLFWAGKQATTRICEIGLNAGHSAMLLLLGRDSMPLEFTVFDVGWHPYTKPALHYLKTAFPHVAFEYIEGDSIKTMTDVIRSDPFNRISRYDVVHVDGGHSEECIQNDMKNANLLVRHGGIIIIDDTNDEHINKYVDIYISSGNYQEINIMKTEGYRHRIIRRIR